MYNKNIKKKSIALATVALVAANSTCVFAQNDKKITKDETVYSLLDENGNVDIAKAQPITFDPFNNKYVVLGDVVGNAFTDGKKLM